MNPVVALMLLAGPFAILGALVTCMVIMLGHGRRS